MVTWLLRVSDQMHVFHFDDLVDGDGMRPRPFINLAGCPHVLANEGHESLPLVLVGHRIGNGDIDYAILAQDDQRRALSGALESAFHIECRRRCIFVLNRTRDIAHQTLHKVGAISIGVATILTLRHKAARQSNGYRRHESDPAIKNDFHIGVHLC